MRTLCVKSTGHFHSGFGPIAGSIYNVDATGFLTQDFRRLPFRNLGRKVYPMDPDARVDWTAGER
jgi:microcystin degradation protein MlrC